MTLTNRILATLFLMAILFIPIISALPRDTELSIDFTYPQPSGNITNIYENNTYINQTLELNSTQFETGEPATIKTSWLTQIIEGVSKWANYYTITEIDNRYSNNTGDQNLSTYVRGNMSADTYNTTTYTPTNGSALSFDGNGDYINLGKDSSLNLINSFTISAWFKTNAISGDHGIVSKMYDASSSPYNLILTTNDLRFETTNSTGGTSIYSYNTILTGNWYHVVATYNGTTSSLYLNGSFVTSASKIGPLVSGSKAAVIGGHQPAVVPTWSFNGVIDEVLIFNRSLNSTEVEQLYNSGIGLYTNTSVAPFNSGLVSAWHFDEGSGTRAVDITGRNNGTLVGGTSWVDGKISHNLTSIIETLGAIGLMPWVSATNFISTDFSLQWIGNALKNPWFNSTELGNSTNRFNGHFWNVTAESIYVEGNISAESFNERTSIYDKSLGSALEFSKDADSLLTKNVIDHKQFYGYVEFEVTDYSKPVKEKVSQEVCNAFGCSIEETEIIIYPYTKIEEGVNLGKEIAVLRQQVYELKVQNELLSSRISKLEKETCEIKLFSWCLK
jgi:hypothetical protein